MVIGRYDQPLIQNITYLVFKMKPKDKKYQLELIHMMKRETNGLLMDFKVELLVYNNKINNLSYFSL